ncbi:MAG: HD domain-containing protein, partial [Columbia Basin potato purple top phytoplasma]
MKYNKPEELQKPEVFNDSIYGYIYINYLFLKKLIDTSPMQRLRRIKQLSFVHMVFSCAEQSRFNHSLGVYELARRFLEINNNILINIFDHRTKMLLLTSALLHDIGHGSYSHTFEIIFKTNHEKQSATIILEHKEINNILDKIDLNFKKDVTSIINKEGKFKLIEQLLSSQLDFDRLDYLRRDAFFTGVSYGYIDSDLLIRSMEIDKKTNKIVFKKSSITSIENYLINRYHMYCRVYYHTKVIGFSVILEQIFKRVDFLFKNKYKFQCSDIISILEKFIN